MAHRNVSAAEWQSFLDQFGHEHRSWITSVESVSPGRPAQTLASNRRLGGLSVCPILDHGNAIEVWFQDSASPPWLLLRNAVAVRLDSNGTSGEEVDISDGEGRTIRIRVRH